MKVDMKIWMIKGEEYLMSYVVILNLHILFLGQLGSISQTQNQNMLSPLKFCETRWGSAWYVMERFFQLYDAIKLFLACIREDENGDPKIKLLFENCLQRKKYFRLFSSSVRLFYALITVSVMMVFNQTFLN